MASTEARLSALEAQVSTLGELLGGTLAACGALNAHIGASFEEGAAGRDLTAMQERLEELEGDIKGLYEKLNAIWPEPS
jgi:hypothetical protein